MRSEMLPAGYLHKRVAAAPEWIANVVPHVGDIHALSGCVSTPFCDYIPHWQHNGYWLFDTPEIAVEIARAEGVDLAPMTLFYYDVFHQQFDERARRWVPLPRLDVPVSVRPPVTKVLSGFDVVTFSQNSAPECSPLSCNQICARVPVNRHCLIGSLQAARDAIDQGCFDNSEPGPFRVIAVYVVEGQAL